ncbi:hypothetical protein [Exiguobacterium sp. s63]|uniref:hypothetical protein n=1 Tax=Exiguobacterium sp. s63 TaxID=2751274 RepID=UPI002036F333|nr:hypothetical protein [Exiguobacterium sp. s63]
MKKLIGIAIIVQTVLFGMLLIQLESLSDTIAQTGAYIATNNGTVDWGAGLPIPFFILLGALIIIGVKLVFSKEKDVK